MAMETFFNLNQLKNSYNDIAAGSRNTVMITPSTGSKILLLKLEGSADAAGDLDIVAGTYVGAGAGDTLETGTATANIGGGTADSNQGAGTAEQHGPIADTISGADSSTVAIAALATWVTDTVSPGDLVTNGTDGSTATVVSVDSETQITTTALTGGTDNLYQAGDNLVITVGGVTLIDTSETFVTDLVAIGDTVRNTTDGSEGVITGLTETVITVGAGLSGGTDDLFENGDNYTIHSATIINDSGETFVTDGVAIGDEVRNTTDGSQGLITGVTETSITCAAGFTGGTNNYTVDTDTFTVHSATVLTDGAATFQALDIQVGDIVTNTVTANSAAVVSVDSDTQLTVVPITGWFTSTDTYTVKSAYTWAQNGGKTIGAATLLNEDMLLPVKNAYKIVLTAGGRLSITYRELG